MNCFRNSAHYYIGQFILVIAFYEWLLTLLILLIWNHHKKKKDSLGVYSIMKVALVGVKKKLIWILTWIIFNI